MTALRITPFAVHLENRYSIPLGDMRTRLLLDALQRCIGVIIAAKAYKWFRFMQTYLPLCFNGEEIEG